MSLRRAGFFRELRHGDPAGPSLAELRGSIQINLRANIAAYLRGGSVLAATGTLVGDWFDSSQVQTIFLELRTDGVWVWPTDLAYYVEKYGVAVPSDLAEHMASRSWRAPALSGDALTAAEREFFSK